MTDDPDLARALTLLADGGYTIGKGWKRAHEIAQKHEGERIFDRVHALCHRIEGDHGNAGYWYGCAGAAPFDGSFVAEAQAIREAAGA